MRTFIAVDLDHALKQALLSLVDTLRRKGGDVRWVKDQGMHITLKFLGEVEPEKISKVESTLKEVTASHTPFSLKIRGTGCFPNEKNPRVLWTGIYAEDSLCAIQRQLEKELEKIGFAREEREFKPHLTLGRVKSASFLGETISELKKYEEKVFGEMIVRKITFFQSVLKPSGAEYIALSEHHLK